MACSIQISSVTGKRLPTQPDPSSILVKGTAQDCAKVKVTIRCHHTVGGVVDFDSADGSATVHPDGTWAVEFLGVQNIHCKCSGSVSVSAWCDGNPSCNVEGSFELPCVVASDCPYVDDINVIIGLAKDPPCVDQPDTPVDITLTAQGPSGPGNYAWKFSDGTTAGGSNVTSVTHTVKFPRPPLTVDLVYTPSKPGCPPSSAPSKVINIPLCPPKGDQGGKPGEETPPPPDKVVIEPKEPEQDDQQKGGGGGSAGCDALLWGAVGTALLGAGLFVGGVCGNAPFISVLGLALGLLGLALFFLWWAICGKITSCGVMQAVHCMLFWMVVAAPAIALGIAGVAVVSKALGYQSGPFIPQEAMPCFAAAAAFWGWVGSLYALLTWAMKTAGCAVRCP